MSSAVYSNVRVSAVVVTSRFVRVAGKDAPEARVSDKIHNIGNIRKPCFCTGSCELGHGHQPTT